MLYMSRKHGQSLRINDDIKITVLDVRGKTIRLGIEYPQGTRILRQEVYESVQQQNRYAEQSAKLLEDL